MTQLTDRLRERMRRAEPLPWAWEQCGEKEDAPVVGVAFKDGEDEPLAGEIRDCDGEVQRWNIASEWGSGINSSAPSANAAFVVEAVNAMPTLLSQADLIEELRREIRAYKEGASILHDHADRATAALIRAEKAEALIEELTAALEECQDKLWIARCDSRDEAFREAAEKACDMSSKALARVKEEG